MHILSCTSIAVISVLPMQKFIHALALRPASSMSLSDLTSPSPDSTPSPFIAPKPKTPVLWSGSVQPSGKQNGALRGSPQIQVTVEGHF